MASRNITVASVQMASGSWTFEENMATAEQLIRAAAAQGASFVLCPELFTMSYFCIDQNVRHLELAESFEGNQRIARFVRLAAELNIVLPIGFSSAWVMRPITRLPSRMRTARCSASIARRTFRTCPGYTEKFYFTPGR